MIKHRDIKSLKNAEKKIGMSSRLEFQESSQDNTVKLVPHGGRHFYFRKKVWFDWDEKEF